MQKIEMTSTSRLKSIALTNQFYVATVMSNINTPDIP